MDKYANSKNANGVIMQKIILNILYGLVLFGLFYGFSRLYYATTDGFAVQHIHSDLPFDERWQTRELSKSEETFLNLVLKQKFLYLGKGCQSYVFESEDGKYVIKFFKYQRLRDKRWLQKFDFLPLVKSFCEKKNAKKSMKREGVFRSWKLSFDHLPRETGILYVHLNKSNYLKQTLHITDKVGVTHSLWIDDYEFMIQKKANMICAEINDFMQKKKLQEANLLLKKFVTCVLSEYERGFADNDHALMQNTGVCDGEPVHVDVGQFIKNDKVKDKNFYLQELYTKTYKFRLWLKDHHPSLCDIFEEHLREVIGEGFDAMQPLWRDQIELFQDETQNSGFFPK